MRTQYTNSIIRKTSSAGCHGSVLRYQNRIGTPPDGNRMHTGWIFFSRAARPTLGGRGIHISGGAWVGSGCAKVLYCRRFMGSWCAKVLYCMRFVGSRCAEVLCCMRFMGRAGPSKFKTRMPDARRMVDFFSPDGYRMEKCGTVFKMQIVTATVPRSRQ